MPTVDDDDVREAPPVVICAVAAGVAPLPFLAVYAVLFIARGTVHPVTPPDIGDSKSTELVAGIVALVLFVIGALAALWLLDGRRRWLFVLCQLAVLAACVDFVVDSSTGSPAIPIVLGLTSLTALVLVALPVSWEHMRQDAPAWMRRGSPGPQQVGRSSSQERIP
jgi:peptidoglycan/LPS O-acetylase OafA/YrhL